MPKSKTPKPARPYHHGDLRRSLIDAAVGLVTDEQDWAFSLREVARRAGVSHNAPYNHFADKAELLACVVAAGFEQLRERMQAAMPKNGSAASALTAISRAYVDFGAENPALYRLMFGPALAGGVPNRPALARDAGLNTLGVLAQIIQRGAESGEFASVPERRRDIELATIFGFSAAHGLTSLHIDNLGASELPMRQLVDSFIRMVLKALGANNR
jgi:AcrR family transcriptional regulator